MENYANSTKLNMTAGVKKISLRYPSSLTAPFLPESYLWSCRMAGHFGPTVDDSFDINLSNMIHNMHLCVPHVSYQTCTLSKVFLHHVRSYYNFILVEEIVGNSCSKDGRDILEWWGCDRYNLQGATGTSTIVSLTGSGLQSWGADHNLP